MLIYKIFILILVLIIITLLLYIIFGDNNTDPVNNSNSLAAESNACLNICPKVYSSSKSNSNSKREETNRPIYEVSSNILPTAFTVFSRDKIIW